MESWETRGRQYTTGHESRRAWVYDDKTGQTPPRGAVYQGHPTVGIGFNLDRVDARAILAAVGASYSTIRDAIAPLTDAQIDRLFEDDWSWAVHGARGCCEIFDTLPDEAKIVLTDMVFNMGQARVAGFHRMLAAFAAQDWTKAADELMDSDYARKDVPARARENRALLLSLVPVLVADTDPAPPGESGST